MLPGKYSIIGFAIDSKCMFGEMGFNLEYYNSSE